ncbi:HAD family hydrolase [Lacticaseibacillus jixianensis]|uniref:HAD family hydrolase n=1 Tax=Lacticaseibacillus jixianensis TaxID=2486012 RepID=A0ABW4B938_9LACO|nr:HAD family hydrolase [Lacticaseibacillus jixianensis]
MNTFVFDIDGTLIDSPNMYLHGLQRMMRRHGKDYALAELTFSNGITSQATMNRLGFTEPAANAAAIQEWIDDSLAFSDLSGWVGNFPEVLTQLRKAGAKIAIVTAKSAAEFAIDDQRYHFSNYTDTHVTTGEAKRDKPAGDPILLAAERLNADRSTLLYIGDTLTDAQAAHDAEVAFGLATWTTPQPTPAFEPIAYRLKQPDDLLKLL